MTTLITAAKETTNDNIPGENEAPRAVKKVLNNTFTFS